MASMETDSTASMVPFSLLYVIVFHKCLIFDNWFSFYLYLDILNTPHNSLLLFFLFSELLATVINS